MRESIKEFVRICARNLPISEPLYEFGALQVSGQEGFADLRPFFPGKKYVGADLRNGPGVDVILDLHHIDLPSGSVGTVLILDTLEHVEFPRKAIENVHRILNENGILVISSVMNFPIHDYPYDYWRFTPEGFRSLLRPFPFSFVDSLGNPDFPHTIVGLALKHPNNHNFIQEFTKQCESWKRSWDETTQRQPRWRAILKPLIPPIVMTLYYKTHKIQKNTKKISL
jgi:SAM-dependent methyltransferase